MRKWWVWVLTVAAAGGLVVAYLPGLLAPRAAGRPRPVPAGDREIAWLHNPTAFDAWENFVWGVKRAEMAGDGGPDGLEVDDSRAFPDKTTSVPEVVLRRKGFAGAVRFRWYKLTNTSTQEHWVKALAAADPPPLAVLGGWSSDRARVLADAMRSAKWRGERPLLFLATATADRVDPDEDDAARGVSSPNLISIYDRSFRFCFTNRQMAASVTDFVMSDPTLRPGAIALPGLRALGAAADLLWPTLPALAFDALPPDEPLPAHAIEWRDDPYSTDLCFKFREALQHCADGACDLPRLAVTTHSVPFSTGRLNRPNPAEAQVAEHILANLPPPGFRSVLVIPTVSAPARRTLRALVQGDPRVGRQLVAVTGDGMGVNVFFRDREFAWPTRSISIPLVLFTHADPFGWDAPGAPAAPPPGYELTAPRPGAVRSSTEDIRLYTRLTRVVSAATFPDGEGELTLSPDRLSERLRALRPEFFDRSGDRLSGTGEHVVVLRPTFAGESARGKQPDGVLEVYTRRPDRSEWVRVHSRPLSRPEGGPQE
ncbi:unnamed protein product [Gemmataceae bacterium]|nr:unnamed protein product [Gemmataceae bacterium]VTT98444.1 unnamed protein product [Gemmataceae bacterium]